MPIATAELTPLDLTARRGLVARAQSGDQDALVELWRYYRPMVRSYVSFRVQGKDPGFIDDLVSDVFLRVLKGLPRFRWQGKDPGAWIITITRNMVIDFFKDKRNGRSTPYAELPDAADTGAAPFEDMACARTDYHDVWDALASVEPRPRECMTLRFVGGLSITETAERMGCTIGAVKALQHRACVSLRADSRIQALGVLSGLY